MMDIETYTKAFDRFLIKIGQVNETFTWEYQSLLDEVCMMLRIGKIEFFYYENQHNESIFKGDFLTLYQKDTPSSESQFEKRQVLGSGAVIVLSFFKKMGEDVWSEEEQKKIDVLATTLCTFNGRIRLEKLVENVLFYDRDLRIPNLAYMHREIAKLRGMRRIHEYAVGFFNLKKFAAVNQMIGRPLGTKVMAQFLVELQQKLRKDGVVSRAGGDNFVVLFKSELFDVVKDHLAGTEILYDRMEGSTVLIKANLGVYYIKDFEAGNDDYIEKAHTAMLSAKRSAEKNCIIFDDELRQASENANVIESVFRESLGKEEFLVCYQPKVNIVDKKMYGAEALCRWYHEGKDVLPNEFIPILEQSNAICSLDFYMLEHVCRDIRAWLDKGYDVSRISVNFSRLHLGDPKLLKKITDIVDKYSVPHDLIELELTEATTDVGFKDLQELVIGLHDNGFYTAVDDFGIGYSSLNLIKDVPWDVIKIDKSLLPVSMEASSPQYILFKHLLSMINDLGIKCIVEGVETGEQVEMIKSNDCDMVQGFFFDKPLSAKEYGLRLA